MTEFLLTLAGGSDIGARGSSKDTKKVIGLKLDILGETLDFCIGVSEGRAKLADIVPLARVLCDRITEVVVRKKCSDGHSIPCCRECSACCSRYLVPLSVPEALRFSEEIRAEPPYRQESIIRACLRAARLILEHKPPKPLISQKEVHNVNPVNLNIVSNWYANLKLACPFLHNHVCSIYSQRPLACREHFITGSVTACEGRHGVAEVLEMPVRLPNVLGQLVSELEGTGLEAVILPLVPVWYEENSERAERSWPAEMVVERFVEIVQATVKKDIPAVASRKQVIIGFSGKRRAASRLYQSLSG